MYGDEIWDEERWEAFLREHDKRTNRYMEVVHTFMVRTPPPDPADVPARRAWEEALQRYVIRKGLRPDDPSIAFLFHHVPPSPRDTLDDLYDAIAPEPQDDLSAFDGVRHLPIYQQAHALATDVLSWTNTLPGSVKSVTLVEFCTHLTQVPPNIAQGHSFGTERDALGGYIACIKRALAHANAALYRLADLRGAAYLDEATYMRLYEHVYELRNALGLYVQDLREQFDLGVD